MPEIVRTMPLPFPRLLVAVFVLCIRRLWRMVKPFFAKLGRQMPRLSSILTKMNAMLIALWPDVRRVIILLWRVCRAFIPILAVCLIILLMLLTLAIW